MNWKKISEISIQDGGGIILYSYDANKIIECSYDGVTFQSGGIVIRPSSKDLFVRRFDFFKESGLYDKLGDYENL